MSNAVLPGDFREVLQRRLGELERQLLRKVAELEDEKSLLHNETSAHRQKTESALNALLQRVTELERGERRAGVSAAPWRPSISRLSTSPPPPPAHRLGTRLLCTGVKWGSEQGRAGLEGPAALPSCPLADAATWAPEGVVAAKPLPADSWRGALLLSLLGSETALPLHP